jgi:hypothetical protein
LRALRLHGWVGIDYVPTEEILMPTRRSPDSPKKTAKPAPETAAPKARKRPTAATNMPVVSEDERRGMIAYSAYLRGERRGFAPGGEAEDWLLAEQEVDALLNSGHSPTQ